MDPMGVANHESKEDAYDYACLNCDAYFNGDEQAEYFGCPACGSYQDVVEMEEYIENNVDESTEGGSESY